MQKKVIVNPYDHVENDYMRLQIKCIEEAGYKAVPQKGNRRNAKYILYNWYENIDRTNGMLLIRKLLMLNYYRFVGKKIIWVMHNKQPHQACNKYSLFMMKYLSQISNAIMILSDETIEHLQKINDNPNIIKKVHKVPLISYESLVGTVKSKKTSKDLHLLMFGRIEPYKCIELLIEAINGCNHKKNIYIKIVGSSNDERYAEKLKKLIGDNNIELDPRFINLEELKDCAEQCDAFILPMDIQSCLNSSAVMMAFSLGRTVICPEIGTTKEMKDAAKFVYSYTYYNVDDHILQLREIIDRAYEERNTLEEKGKLVLKNIQQNNSIEVVAQCFDAMFKACR